MKLLKFFGWLWAITSFLAAMGCFIQGGFTSWIAALLLLVSFFFSCPAFGKASPIKLQGSVKKLAHIGIAICCMMVGGTLISKAEQKALTEEFQKEKATLLADAKNLQNDGKHTAVITLLEKYKDVSDSDLKRTLAISHAIVDAQKAEEEKAENAKKEAERLAKVEAEQKAKEEQEKAAKVKEEAERIAKAGAERKAKEEQEQAAKTKEEAERTAKAENEKKEKEKEAELVAKTEAERKAKEEAEKKANPKPFEKREVKVSFEPIAIGEMTKEDKKLAKTRKNEGEAIAKKMKWSLNGNPETSGKEDGEMYWKVISDEKAKPDWLIMSVNSRSKVDDAITYAFVCPESDISLAGSKSFEDEEGDRMDAYEKAFKAAVKEKRSKWIDENVGECPSENAHGKKHGMGGVIQSLLNNPDSFQFVKYDTMALVKHKGIWAWKVDYYYRGQNAFGAVITTHAYVYDNVLYYLNTGSVVDIETPKD